MSRYLGFYFEHGLIRVAAERSGRGRYPSKGYDLIESGWRLLEIFEEQGALESPGVKNQETGRLQP